jgi:hypothetical protein
VGEVKEEELVDVSQWPRVKGVYEVGSVSGNEMVSLSSIVEGVGFILSLSSPVPAPRLHVYPQPQSQSVPLVERHTCTPCTSCTSSTSSEAESKRVQASLRIPASRAQRIGARSPLEARWKPSAPVI